MNRLYHIIILFVGFNAYSTSYSSQKYSESWMIDLGVSTGTAAGKIRDDLGKMDYGEDEIMIGYLGNRFHLGVTGHYYNLEPQESSLSNSLSQTVFEATGIGLQSGFTWHRLGLFAGITKAKIDNVKSTTEDINFGEAHIDFFHRYVGIKLLLVTWDAVSIDAQAKLAKLTFDEAASDFAIGDQYVSSYRLGLTMYLDFDG